MRVSRRYSERRACKLIRVDRSSFQYRREAEGDAAIRTRLRELANERRRFGYRRLAILLKREGVRMNLKKVYPPRSGGALVVRRRGGRKRALGTRAPAAVPQGANQRWSLDFVSDALNDGRRFRVLNIVDDFTRECLAAVVDTSLSGARVVRELNEVIARRGKPCMIVSGKLLPQHGAARARVFEQLFFHASGLSPAFGNAGFFKRSSPEPQPIAEARFIGEAERILGLLDTRLAGQAFAAGDDFTIADIAHFGWLWRRQFPGLTLDGRPNLSRWYDEVAARPAVQRAVARVEALIPAA